MPSRNHRTGRLALCKKQTKALKKRKAKKSRALPSYGRSSFSLEQRMKDTLVEITEGIECWREFRGPKFFAWRRGDENVDFSNYRTVPYRLHANSLSQGLSYFSELVSIKPNDHVEIVDGIKIQGWLDFGNGRSSRKFQELLDDDDAKGNQRLELHNTRISGDCLASFLIQKLPRLTELELCKVDISDGFDALSDALATAVQDLRILVIWHDVTFPENLTLEEITKFTTALSVHPQLAVFHYGEPSQVMACNLACNVHSLSIHLNKDKSKTEAFYKEVVTSRSLRSLIVLDPDTSVPISEILYQNKSLQSLTLYFNFGTLPEWPSSLFEEIINGLKYNSTLKTFILHHETLYQFDVDILGFLRGLLLVLEESNNILEVLRLPSWMYSPDPTKLSRSKREKYQEQTALEEMMKVFLQFNKVGRNRIWQDSDHDASCRREWLNTILVHKENISAVFYLLLSNPSLICY